MQYEINGKVKELEGFKSCLFCDSDDLRADTGILTYNRTNGLYEQDVRANIYCRCCGCLYQLYVGKNKSANKRLNKLKKRWNQRV